MIEMTEVRIKEKVISYLQIVDGARNRDIAAAIDPPKPLVDKIVDESTEEEKVEYVWLGPADESVRM